MLKNVNSYAFTIDYCGILILVFNLLQYPGISRDKTMGDKFMYIPYDDTQEYRLCRLKWLLKKLDTSSLLQTNIFFKGTQSFWAN